MSSSQIWLVIFVGGIPVLIIIITIISVIVSNLSNDESEQYKAENLFSYSVNGLTKENDRKYEEKNQINEYTSVIKTAAMHKNSNLKSEQEAIKKIKSKHYDIDLF